MKGALPATGSAPFAIFNVAEARISPPDWWRFLKEAQKIQERRVVFGCRLDGRFGGLHFESWLKFIIFVS
ncbi:MAG: hypothetical protein K2I48_01695 [Muribaculaceae bacterium]|nr:hypothetical protein [Muribaculaceae bacterium]